VEAYHVIEVFRSGLQLAEEEPEFLGEHQQYKRSDAFYRVTRSGDAITVEWGRVARLELHQKGWVRKMDWGWTGSAGVAEVVMKKLIGKKTKGRGYRHPAKNWRDEDFGSDECACMCPERCNCSGYKRFKCCMLDSVVVASGAVGMV